MLTPVNSYHVENQQNRRLTSAYNATLRHILPLYTKSGNSSALSQAELLRWRIDRQSFCGCLWHRTSNPPTNR
jgi:hypothetical protein